MLFLGTNIPDPDPMSRKKDPIVKLNIGGSRFQTLFSTLKDTEPKSQLSMLADQAITLITDNKEVFVDRNGSVFQYILDYLRDPEVFKLPFDRSLVEQIKVEAEFYELDGLIAIIEQPVSPFTIGDMVQIRPDIINVWATSSGYKNLDLRKFAPLRHSCLDSCPYMNQEAGSTTPYCRTSVRDLAAWYGHVGKIEWYLSKHNDKNLSLIIKFFAFEDGEQVKECLFRAFPSVIMKI